MNRMPHDYTYHCYVVVHQWALLNGWSGINRLSLRAWLKLPNAERRDFSKMIRGCQFE